MSIPGQTGIKCCMRIDVYWHVIFVHISISNHLTIIYLKSIIRAAGLNPQLPTSLHPTPNLIRHFTHVAVVLYKWCRGKLIELSLIVKADKIVAIK